MSNLTWHNMNIDRENRENLLEQKGFLLWITGLSGSGKSTVGSLLENRLHQMNKLTYILDGDNIRIGLNKDLDFTEAGRVENIRRISEVGKLFVDAGIITIATFIAPFEKDRESVRTLLGKNYIEVYAKCSLETCENRDPKGLYKKAREKVITNFTGIDSPYEVPNKSEVIIDTDSLTIEESVEKIIDFLVDNRWVSREVNY